MPHEFSRPFFFLYYTGKLSNFEVAAYRRLILTNAKEGKYFLSVAANCTRLIRLYLKAGSVEDIPKM